VPVEREKVSVDRHTPLGGMKAWQVGPEKVFVNPEKVLVDPENCPSIANRHWVA
jgi:hypothetical protein